MNRQLQRTFVCIHVLLKILPNRTTIGTKFAAIASRRAFSPGQNNRSYRRKKKRMNLRTLSAVLALLGATAACAHADATDGNLFYTTFAGGTNVHRVDYDYDGTTTFTLFNNTPLAAVEGADGIIFAPNGNLLVGGQGPRVHEVQTDGTLVQTVHPGIGDAFHLALNPDRATVYAMGIPGGAVGVMPFPLAAGTGIGVTGDDTSISSIAFDAAGNAYYTNAGPGGTGAFGKITDLSTMNTMRLLSDVPAAHGMAFDPFTGDLMLFGDGHVTQVTTAGVIVSDRAFDGVNFDQGTVDGNGHAFVASNTGHLLFVDYSGTGLIGDLGNFTSLQFLNDNLDDVAPLVGPGAPPDVPEPGAVAILACGLIGAGFISRRRKK
jgi:hypothetical protein